MLYGAGGAGDAFAAGGCGPCITGVDLMDDSLAALLSVTIIFQATLQ